MHHVLISVFYFFTAVLDLKQSENQLNTMYWREGTEQKMSKPPLKTSFQKPVDPRHFFFIEVPVSSQEESERSYICVLEVSILPLSTILIFDFRTVQTMWYFRTVQTMWYFRTVLTMCYFRTVQTMWYFRTVLTMWYFRTVQTMWYFRTVQTMWYFRTVPTLVF